MTNKNITLSLIVQIASVGTALATSFMTPQSTWIHGFKFVSGNQPIETCSTLDNKCETTGIRNCEITVNVNGIPTSTIGHLTNVCTTPLKHTEEQIDDEKTTIYQEIDTYHPD